MVRIKKPPEVRSNELLDCAQRLFFTRGYESTTVNDIIREAGVSKGAFYHYFPSKEALLETLAVRLSRENLKQLRPLFDDPSINAIGRLNALFAGSRRLKVELAPQLRNTFNVLFKPENVVLFHRINEALTAVVQPLLADILKQGHEEGSLNAPDPQAFALMLLELRLSVGKVMHQALKQAETGDIDGAVTMLDDWMLTYGIALDRILKLPEGTLQVAEPGFARAFLTSE
ncbi:TetR/AcrR family transcriptional regulator [Neorhizobium petrolearium]|uniref:TetR/AcrR family transcriptional regulator n=1 Tax=Neorhizobium petrolearium TaxID=515361 RepID=A0ABY8M532_9HYPH|nr:TetR/AcrR family transcriptional regulator [Neorhizobium petrolearium]MCC2608862.1 TetR/AcrR family transcriptional regulator [Neorhizobium petrolearium]WGI69111.1 TetR/AcrR family transcriptional regulator [Neorhizobium petrolearium]